MSAMVLPAAPAAAHAIVESTSPAIDETVDRSPARVVMRFNEPVEIAFGAIRVFDTTGERVDNGETAHVEGRADEIQVSVEPDLAKGTYTVAWRVISADGHPISEAFVFHVQEPGENPEGIAGRILNDEGSTPAGVAFGIVRWLGFASLLVLAGGLIFMAAVWDRTARLGQRTATTEAAFTRRASAITGVAWVTALLATLASLPLQAAVAGGLPLAEIFSPDVLGEISGTRFGIVALSRAGVLVIGALLWAIAGKRALRPVLVRSAGAARERPRLTPDLLFLGGIFIAALLATPGLAGHAGTTPPIALNLVADDVHLIAAAAWIGGLVMLAFGAFPSTTGETPEERASTLAPLVSRYSGMAMIAVAVLVVTGTFRAWWEVGALRALTGAPYGLVLLAKIAVFIPLVALGALNNRRFKPRIREAASSEDGRRALHLLKRVVVVEVVLAAVVVGITSLLVNLPPARIAAGVSGPFVKDVALGPHRLNVLVDPNEVGENEVHLTATTSAGAPARVRGMSVLFRMPSEDIGPLKGKGRRLAPGHFVVQGRQLSVAGTWQLEIVVRTSRFDEERTTVTVEVND